MKNSANDLEDGKVTINDETKEAFAKYIAEYGAVDSWTPEQKEALVKYLKDSSIPDSYEADDENATVTYEKDTSDIDSFDPPNFIRTITYKIKDAFSNAASNAANAGKKRREQRFGGVNGTANADGTTGRAFKQGSWGTKNSGTALVGELGREILRPYIVICIKKSI